MSASDRRIDSRREQLADDSVREAQNARRREQYAEAKADDEPKRKAKAPPEDKAQGSDDAETKS